MSEWLRTVAYVLVFGATILGVVAVARLVFRAQEADDHAERRSDAKQITYNKE